MPTLDDQRREKFCQFRVQGKSRDESYKLAGYKPDRQNAARLTTKDDIKARIKELQAKLAEEYVCTTDSLARELDQAITYAIKWEQGSAIVAAINTKAKLFGHLTDKSSVVVTHNYQMMSEEEIRFELAALAAEARSIKPGVQH